MKIQTQNGLVIGMYEDEDEEWKALLRHEIRAHAHTVLGMSFSKYYLIAHRNISKRYLGHVELMTIIACIEHLYTYVTLAVKSLKAIL